MKNEQRKSSKSWLWTILTVIIAAIVGTVVYFNTDTIDRWTGHEKPVAAQDETVDSIQQELIDSVEITENPTVEEYLQYRSDMIEQDRQEKVFKTMPEVVLADILLQHGTALSIYDIVEIYENYPETYNKVQSGARTQQFLDSIHSRSGGKEPDVLPKPAMIDNDLFH